MTILVAGLGSDQGADRFGWEVIGALETFVLPALVTLVACRSPAELTSLLLSSRYAIIIDAFLGMGPPGHLSIIDPDSLEDFELCGGGGAHGIGVVEAIQLARALGYPIDHCQIIGLDVTKPDMRLESAWVPMAVSKILAILTNHLQIC